MIGVFSFKSHLVGGFAAYHKKEIAFENKVASEMTDTQTSFQINEQSLLPPNKDGIQDVKLNFNFGTFQFNVILQGTCVPAHMRGCTYVYPERSLTNVVKSVDE